MAATGATVPSLLNSKRGILFGAFAFPAAPPTFVLHFRQILNFCMLTAVCIIWRPTERSAMLAYSKQVISRSTKNTT